MVIKKCENARKHLALMCVNVCVYVCVCTHTYTYVLSCSVVSDSVALCSPREDLSGLPFPAPGCLFLLFTLYIYVQFICTEEQIHINKQFVRC